MCRYSVLHPEHARPRHAPVFYRSRHGSRGELDSSSTPAGSAAFRLHQLRVQLLPLRAALPTVPHGVRSLLPASLSLHLTCTPTRLIRTSRVTSYYRPTCENAIIQCANCYNIVMWWRWKKGVQTITAAVHVNINSTLDTMTVGIWETLRLLRSISL